jgi:hypothetical protein
MARRTRSFFFDNINKKLLTNTTKNTSDVKDDIDNDTNISSSSMTRAATQSLVDTEIAALANSAPATLNTLDELAAALGDDANFSTTVTTSLSNRLRIDVSNQGLTGAQKTNALTNLGITASLTELNKLDGVSATTAELNYVDGVTSNIQTQLDGKQASGSYLTGNQTITLSGDVSGSGTTSIVVTVADDSHNHIISNVDGLQAALDAKVASLADLSITATATELNYLDGVTSNIQTQLNGKLSTSGTAVQANNLNATDDRDIAPEDLGYSDDFRIYFAEKGGLETGSVGSNYQDVLVLNSYSDNSGGDVNALAFDKSEKKIYHYQADQTATNWGTAKTLAYTDDITLSTQQLSKTTLTSSNDLGSGGSVPLADGWYAWGSSKPLNGPDDYGIMYQLYDGNQPQQWVMTYGGSANSVDLYGRRRTSSSWDTIWTKFLHERNNLSIIKLLTNQTTSIQQSAWTTHLWNTQSFIDTDMYTHSTASLTERVYVDKTGYYQITANLIYDNNTSSARNTVRAVVFVNGTEQTSTATYDYDRGASYGERSNNKINTILSLTANDYVEIKAYGHNIDGTCSVYGTECELMMMRIK